MITNLLKIGYNRILPERLLQQRFTMKRHDYLRRAQENVVKKALFKHMPEDQARFIIQNFRRSKDDPEAARIDFLKTDQPYHPVDRDYHYRRALRVTHKLFKPSRPLHPISFPDLRYFPWTLNVSAEYPYNHESKWHDYVRQKHSEGEVDNDRLTFHNLYNEIFEQNRRFIHDIKYKRAPFWNERGEPVPYGFTTLHSRSHIAKEGKPDKIRAVYGVPKLLLMAENMFIWPLQEQYLNERSRSPMLWGCETFRGGWYKIYKRFENKRCAFYFSTDWSGFDHKALHSIIDDVHDIWRSYFDFSQYEPTNHYPDPTTNEDRLQNLWDWMTDAIKHTPIRLHNGDTFIWRHNGIMSGFQQTQLLDSFVNTIMTLTTLSALGINIESEDFTYLVQGDDSLTGMAEKILDPRKFLELFSQEAKRRFNADMSPEKTTFGESLNDIEVLSYRNREGLAYRDPNELLAHFLYPERPRTLSQLASSAIGIATASMGMSDSVYAVCADVYHFLTVDRGITAEIDNEDWFRRGLSPPSIARFPTQIECLLNQFNYKDRDSKMIQRLWPTTLTAVTPENPLGFKFLNL